MYTIEEIKKQAEEILSRKELLNRNVENFYEAWSKSLEKSLLLEEFSDIVRITKIIPKKNIAEYYITEARKKIHENKENTDKTKLARAIYAIAIGYNRLDLLKKNFYDLHIDPDDNQLFNAAEIASRNKLEEIVEFIQEEFGIIF